MNLKNEILKIVRSITNPIGYDIVKYRSTYPAQIVLNHLNINRIETVVDVGANEGQYSCELRKAGYKDSIISFEPLHDAFKKLEVNAAKYKNWKAYNIALGDTNGSASIHVSKHSPSSSLLPMTRLHAEAPPGSEYLSEEVIEIRTLDGLYDSLQISSGNIFLKIDTQGYEKKVLNGSLNSLSQITGIQLELSTVELYEGEEKYFSLCRFIEDRGFHLVRVIPGFSHPGSKVMLQFDAIFFQK